MEYLTLSVACCSLLPRYMQVVWNHNTWVTWRSQRLSTAVGYRGRRRTSLSPLCWYRTQTETSVKGAHSFKIRAGQNVASHASYSVSNRLLVISASPLHLTPHVRTVPPVGNRLETYIVTIVYNSFYLQSEVCFSLILWPSRLTGRQI